MQNLKTINIFLQLNMINGMKRLHILKLLLIDLVLGIKPCGICTEGGHERKYTPEKLIENLETVWKRLGFPPTRRKINKYGEKISEAPYRKIWGSLKSACEQLALFHQGEITKEQLLLKSNTTNGCYVYLMKNTKNDCYKIGISNSPEFREKTLQSEEPSIQTIARKKMINRKIARDYETSLHENFSHKRKRGEWFQLYSERS